MKKTIRINSSTRKFSFICFVISILSIIPISNFAQTPDAETEAETGTIAGPSVLTSLAGYSGSGYVGRFENTSDLLTMTVNVQTADLYEIVIRYACPYGEKTIDIDVNSIGYSQVVLAESSGWENISAGNFSLNAGDNTVKIKPNWTWFLIDKITVYKVAPKDFSKVTTQLINSNADANTYALYNFIKSNYTSKIISGQTESYYDTIVKITGKRPMLKVWDFQHFTIGYPYLWDNNVGGHVFGWHDDGTTEDAIAWYNSTGKKGIVGYQWHWHSPGGGAVSTNTFYTNSTSFDVRQAVISGTAENTAILRDIDSIATQLKKFKAAGIPILWRPLHEAGGGWFWWGAHGAAPCLQLWDIVYNRLTNHHGLNNLIWVWSTPEADWFPGLEKVDMIGYDSYPGAEVYAPQTSFFNMLFDIVNGEKIVALTENGPIPDPQACFENDAPWSFFMSWADLVKEQNSRQHIIDVYNHPDMLTLDDNTTGIQLFTGSDKLIKDAFIYPNPTGDILYIKKNSDIYQVSIVAMDGKIVLSSKKPTNNLDISNLDSGVYTIVISGKEGVSSAKFVKE